MLVVDCPGLSVPAVKLVTGVVHPLSWYTPMLIVVMVATDPLKPIVWFTLSAASVVTVRIIPMRATAIIDSVMDLLIINQSPCLLRLDY